MTVPGLTKRSLRRIAEEQQIRAKEERKARDYADWRAAARKTAASWPPEQAAAEAKRDIAAYRAEECGIEQFYIGEDVMWKSEANPHYSSKVRQVAPDVVAAIEHARATLKTVRPGRCS